MTSSRLGRRRWWSGFLLVRWVPQHSRTAWIPRKFMTFPFRTELLTFYMMGVLYADARCPPHRNKKQVKTYMKTLCDVDML